jgi:ABC-type ATPase involved in cell division
MAQAGADVIAIDWTMSLSRARKQLLALNKPLALQGNLDPLISWEIMELLMDINRLGVTVLVATHDSDIVTTLRRRVIGLEGGRLIRDEANATYHRVG